MLTSFLRTLDMILHLIKVLRKNTKLGKKLKQTEWECAADGCDVRRLVSSRRKNGKQQYTLTETGSHAHEPVLVPSIHGRKNSLVSWNRPAPPVVLMEQLKEAGLDRGCEHKHVAGWLKRHRKSNAFPRNDSRLSEFQSLEKELVEMTKKVSNDINAPLLLEIPVRLCVISGNQLPPDDRKTAVKTRNGTPVSYTFVFATRKTLLTRKY